MPSRLEGAPPLTNEARADYLKIAREKAREYGINIDVFIRMVTRESQWDPYAISEDGAQGLAQIVPAKRVTDQSVYSGGSNLKRSTTLGGISRMASATWRPRTVSRYRSGSSSIGSIRPRLALVPRKKLIES